MSQAKVTITALAFTVFGAGSAFADANHHEITGNVAEMNAKGQSSSEKMHSGNQKCNHGVHSTGMGGHGMHASGLGGHNAMMMNMMHMVIQMHGGMMGANGMGGSGFSQSPFSKMGPEMMNSFDMDGNGSLTLKEFEPMYMEMMRENLVDFFQILDADGDGLAIQSEMVSPADRMRLQSDNMDN